MGDKTGTTPRNTTDEAELCRSAYVAAFETALWVSWRRRQQVVELNAMRRASSQAEKTLAEYLAREETSARAGAALEFQQAVEEFDLLINQLQTTHPPTLVYAVFMCENYLLGLGFLAVEAQDLIKDLVDAFAGNT